MIAMVRLHSWPLGQTDCDCNPDLRRSVVGSSLDISISRIRWAAAEVLVRGTDLQARACRIQGASLNSCRGRLRTQPSIPNTLCPCSQLIHAHEIQDPLTLDACLQRGRSGILDEPKLCRSMRVSPERDAAA